MLHEHKTELLLAVRTLILVVSGLVLVMLLYWQRAAIGPVSLWVGIAAICVGGVILVAPHSLRGDSQKQVLDQPHRQAH